MQTLDRTHLVLDLVGGRCLADDAPLAAVLDAFEEAGLEPDTWAIGEPPGRDYAREEVERALRGKSATAVGLWRERAPSFHAVIFGRDRPRVVIRFAPAPDPRHHAAIGALGDALAAAQRPDIGWLQPVADVEPPFDDETAATRCRMDQCCDGSVSVYDDFGPCGLGARTWLGAAMVELIGRERLRGAPVQVEGLAWGGLRVDLVDDPLDADDGALASAWTAAMAALVDAGVFARSTLDEEGFADFERGARFNLDPHTRSLRDDLEACAADGRTLRDLSAPRAALGGAALFGLRADALDLRDADLRDAAFNDARLTDCGLAGARLDGATFDRAHLWQCDLRRALGHRVRFREAQIEASFFQGASLSAADFAGARLADVYFDGATMTGASFAGATSDGARFNGAQLDKADFTGARLGGADFTGARLDGALFTGAQLEGAVFTGARLDGATFIGTQLDGADFADAATEGTARTTARLDGTGSARSASPPDDIGPEGSEAEAKGEEATTTGATLAKALLAMLAPAIASGDETTLAEGLVALLSAASAGEQAELARLLGDPSQDSEPWPAEMQALVAEIRALSGSRPEQVAQAARVLLGRLSTMTSPADALSTHLPSPSGRGPESESARADRLHREAADAIAAAMRARGLDPD